MLTKVNGEDKIMKEFKKIPEAEFEVMMCLWKADKPLKASGVVQELETTKGWTRSTINVLLARLEERSYVVVTRKGNIKSYAPMISFDEYQANETNFFMDKLHHNSVTSLFATLVKTKKLKSEDIDELEELLRKMR